MPHPEKLSLRKSMRQSLSRISKEESSASSQKALELLANSPLWKAAQTILLFASTPLEPQTEPIACKALADGKKICYPRTLDSLGSMEIRQIDNLSQLTPGRWDIPEPTENCPRITVPEIDLALIPGVAFDREGCRLGHGGGYYDRLLSDSAFKAVKVGYFFSIQETAKLPVEIHDQKMDWILTERELSKVH